MSERFPDDARRVAELALQEASGLSHTWAGTEHLLLGVLKAGSDVADRALTPLTLADARAETVRLVDGCVATDLGAADAEALRAVGIDLDRVRHALEDTFGPGALEDPQTSAAPAHARRLPFTPRAKKALELSVREARRLDHRSFGPEHILLGLLLEGRGLATQVIATRAPLADVRRRLLAELDPAA